MTWLEQVLGKSRVCPLGGKCNYESCKNGCYDADAAKNLRNLSGPLEFMGPAYKSAIGHLSLFRRKRIADRMKTTDQLEKIYNNIINDPQDPE